MCRIAASVVIGSLALVTVAEEPTWHENLDKAQSIAAEQGKDLFINFTGTSWCAHCKDLEIEILRDPAFAEAVESFVLVELDYPGDLNDLPEEKRSDFIRWRDRYGVEGFPTILLTDSSGKPYAVTGYEPGGANVFFESFKVKRNAHVIRDAEFAKAREASGVDKARHLAAALAAVQNACAGEWLQCHGDGLGDHPLVRFYRDEVGAIVSLDAENTAGLKAQYDALLLSEQERQRWRAILDDISKIRRDEGADAALEAIARQYEETPAGSRRNELRRIRQIYLEWAGRYEEALTDAREMARDESFPRDQRWFLRKRIAYNLRKLDRVDEAVAVYDELLVEVRREGDRDAIWRCQSDKARMLTYAGRPQAAQQAWQAALEFVEPGSPDWIDNKIFLARLLEELERYDEAIAAYEAVRPHYSRRNDIDRAFLDAQSARAMMKAGDKERARQRIETAEEFLKKAPTDERQAAIKQVRKMIESTREAIEQPATP